MHIVVQILLASVGTLAAIASIILIHEWGHFIVARLLGFKVDTFSIGFGRTIWRKRCHRGTEFRLSWIPLGGYIKLREQGQFAYTAYPIYKRMLVVLAGILMNLLFATALFSAIYVVGFETPKPVIGDVIINSPAYHAGIVPGDQFVSINNQDVKTWSRVMMSLLLHYGDNKPLPLTVQRGSEAHLINLPMEGWKIDGLRPNLWTGLGFMPEKGGMMITVKSSWHRCWLDAGHEVAKLASFNAIIMKKVLFHQLPTDLMGGPVSLFEQAGKASLQGLIAYLGFIAYLNILLALINILPIPLLDGGQFLLLVIEAIRRKPLSDNALLLAQRIGFIVIALLLIQASLNDIQRLFI